MKTKLKRPSSARGARPRKCCKPKRALVVAARDRQLFKEMRGEMRPGLERDTELMPWLIAESVCQEVSLFLDVELPDRYAVWMEAKAELCYARDRRFHEHMRAMANRAARLALLLHAPLAVEHAATGAAGFVPPPAFGVFHRPPPSRRGGIGHEGTWGPSAFSQFAPELGSVARNPASLLGLAGAGWIGKGG